MASKARGGSAGRRCEAGILFTHSGKIGGIQLRQPGKLRLLYAHQVVKESFQILVDRPDGRL